VRHRPGTTALTPLLLVTGAGTFMAGLDNLVVTAALPRIRDGLGADLESLEWTINAYTLTFAVLLLAAAGLGDRFGRRTVFALGLAVFTAASALAALATTAGMLVVARALQGIGAAVIVPIALVLAATAVPPARRGAAIAALGALAGLAIAIGPLVGGLVVEAADWYWIFWLNVPIGLVLVPLALRVLPDSRGPAGPVDVVGIGLATVGLAGVVFGVIAGGTSGWAQPRVWLPVALGVLVLAGFGWWERRAAAPLVPPRLVAGRGFAAAGLVALLVQASMIGAVFLLTQYFQLVLGYSPAIAGLRTLPWTVVPLLAAPLAGMLADRVGVRVLVAGSALAQVAALAWFALVVAPAVDYPALVGPMLLAGAAMGVFFALTGRQALDLAPAAYQGVASGVNNAMRQLGAVLGVVLAGAVFARAGGFGDPETFVRGLRAALWTGAGVAVLAVGCALAVPRPAGDGAQPPVGRPSRRRSRVS
jgi:EmrB/QacA subfamily drug resistance transporter